MEGKTFFFIFVLIVIVSGGFIFFYSGIDFSPASVSAQLEECKTLKYNGENAVNIVFFSDASKAKRYSDYLMSISPFKENNNKFNFYYIDSYKPKCELYKDIALFCYSKEMAKVSSSCPNDYIVALEDRSSSIRSSSYLNVMSLNSNHQLSVFAHEFGHAFAFFAEEYVPGSVSSNTKNCVAECSYFEGKAEGCFEGCSRNDYMRSIESGIMRTLSSNSYGDFDEFILSQRLEKMGKSSITGNAISEACDENMKYSLVDFEVTDEGLVNIGKEVAAGCVNDNGVGDYALSLVLDDGKVVDSGSINAELLFTDLPLDEDLTGETYQYRGIFSVKIPYIENAKELRVVNPEGMAVVADLTDIGARPCRI